MLTIYLSGNLSADSHYTDQVARNLLREGHAVFIPLRSRSYLADWVNESDLEFLKRSDSIYMMQGWGTSHAAQQELELALRYKKQLFFEGSVEPA